MKSTFKFASLARSCLFALAVTLFHSSSFAQVAAPESAVDPRVATKGLKYNSAFADYKPIGNDAIGLWRDINQQVTGGMTSMRGDSMPRMEGMNPSANSFEKTPAPPVPTQKRKAKRPTGKAKKTMAHDPMPMKMN